MPIPDTPYTRKEAYLNAVATGDSSGIPETPYTREEMYLDAIAKGGEGGGGGSSTLSGLTDVDISNPTDGQTLVYDATSEKWVNGESAGGGALIVHSDGEGTLDATWQEISDAQSVLLIERRNVGEGQYIEFFTPLAVCGYAPPVEQSGPAYIAVFGDATYTSETSDGYPAVLR